MGDDYYKDFRWSNVLSWTGLIIGFRVWNAITVCTSFDPDEYWQSMEIAHNNVFGYGYKTWEWEQEWKVRSWVYPGIISWIYWILKILRLDSYEAIIYAPKILHGILTGINDIITYQTAVNWFGVFPGQYALLCSLLNWFNFYSLTRTYSNTFETYLTMMGLCFWPFRENKIEILSKIHRVRRRIVLCFAAMACLIRVTNVCKLMCYFYVLLYCYILEFM